jgi:hypothetical protein
MADYEQTVGQIKAGVVSANVLPWRYWRLIVAEAENS